MTSTHRCRDSGTKFSKCLLRPFVGTALAAGRYRRSRYKASINDNLPFAFASHHNRIFYTTRVSAFSFYLKKKTPAKEKQTQGYAPRPRQRHAAVHSSRLSIGCSAHSRANAPELEQVRARASCFASRSLAPLRKLSNTTAWLLKV